MARASEWTMGGSLISSKLVGHEASLLCTCPAEQAHM
jgi:hypothetical protein